MKTQELFVGGLFDAQIAEIVAAEEAAAQAAREAERDLLGERLIAHKYVANDFHLNLNSTLSPGYDEVLPYPWNLPSRLMGFPVETQIGEDGERHIGLMHPLLREHPLVKKLEADGFTVEDEGAPNEYGYTHFRNGWWHACDLMTYAHYRDLLDTRQFTTTGDIAHAIAFRCRHVKRDPKHKDGISTVEAREILAALGCTEPVDGSVGVLATYGLPQNCPQGDGKKARDHWPVNHARRLETEADYVADAWARVHGLEGGWFAPDRAGFVAWTVKGREWWEELNPGKRAKHEAALRRERKQERELEEAVSK